MTFDYDLHGIFTLTRPFLAAPAKLEPTEDSR
jgi:hypothetical protein